MFVYVLYVWQGSVGICLGQVSRPGDMPAVQKAPYLLLRHQLTGQTNHTVHPAINVCLRFLNWKTW